MERLRTILRLQRDEFLPLRVDPPGARVVDQRGVQRRQPGASSSSGRSLTEPAPTRRYSADDVTRTTGAGRDLLRALEEYGLLNGGAAGGYDETDREVVQTAMELAAYGVEPRHLRLFRVAAEREAGLLEQVLAAGLRSRNPDRRREALAALESLAALAAHMRHLMLVSELRQIVP